MLFRYFFTTETCWHRYAIQLVGMLCWNLAVYQYNNCW